VTGYLIGIDTGGTYTDAYLAAGKDRYWTVKVPTTPHDLTVCFAQAIAGCAEAAGVDVATLLRSTAVIRFSSTIGTNAILTRSGPKLGLLVTRGAEASLYGAAASGRIFEFIRPEMVAGIDEQTSADGRVARLADPAQASAAARALLERGARMLVVSLAGSALNPANERAVFDAISASYPRHYLGAVPTLLSVQVSAEADDASRTAAAVVNAYMHPPLARSLYRAEDDLRRCGLRHPLLVVGADGSVTRVAKTRALSTYQSGPASGVQAGALLAAASGIDAAVTADVGGTSTDLSAVAKGRPARSRYTDIAGLAIPQPSVDVVSLALGGGSVCRADSGTVTVGPQSSGAVPGPACFGLGGQDPTPTDAWLVLGYLDARHYLGGRRKLQPDAAARVLAERIGSQLGVDGDGAALAVASAAEQSVTSAISSLLAAPATRARLGESNSDVALIGYGGGSGILLPGVAPRLGLRATYLPRLAPVFSAFGAGSLDVHHRYQARLPGEGRGLAEVAGSLAQAAERDVRSEGLDPASALVSISRLDDPGEPLASDFRLPGLAAELARLRLPAGTALVVTTTCEVAKPGLPTIPAASSPDPAEAELGKRELTTRSGRTVAPVYDGDRLRAGHRLAGPAVLERGGTTALIPAGMTCEIDRFGTAIVTE
jgi:N-methylhydantoinase A